ncbi:hypothetical protein QO004_004786 [Rhizobium mesoamericanum]|nr:hypothetical protein [Rhizobium mesoamericanum]
MSGLRQTACYGNGDVGKAVLPWDQARKASVSRTCN